MMVLLVGIIASLLLMMISGRSMNTSWSQIENQVASNSTRTDNCGIIPQSPPCEMPPFLGQIFNAKLNGSSEVPPVDTQATGIAKFQVVKYNIQNGTGEDELQYDVNVTGLGATAAHIHTGKVGGNGPIVVTLYNNTIGPFPCCNPGTITAGNLEGPLEGKPLSDLINMMENEETYVNVHTERYMNGEIRGQIVSSSNSSVVQ